MVQVTVSWVACHEFELSTAKDPLYREGRCKIVRVYYLPSDQSKSPIADLRTPNFAQVVEVLRDSPEVNVFFCHSSVDVYESFVFREPTVSGSAYLDALQLLLFPQLKGSEPDNSIWQEAAASSYWYLSERDWLNISVLNQRSFLKGPLD
ncbi:hypothetical protein TNCV_2759171 [Trichonephila clavipes]|nr:hypothetical protein TNCV_2759171 [Trichonephila clavipes]